MNLLLKEFFMKLKSRKQKDRWNKLTAERTRRHLRRRWAFLWSAYLKRNAQKKHLLNNTQRGYCQKIVAPADFDLVKNPHGVMEFFKEIKFCFLNNIPVEIDMEHITTLSLNALLYLIAIMQNNKLKGRLFSIRGNTPADSTCKKLFESSGFYNYVRQHNASALEIDDHAILRITSNNIVSTDVLIKLCNFITECLGYGKSKTRPVYEVIVEMMQNTFDHAYENKRCDSERWFVSAKYDADLKEIEIAFLDTGYGIPATAKKRFLEKILDKIDIMSENQIIFSALKGDFRTKTEQQWHGKGLPEIYNKYKSGILKELTILSGKGYVNLTKNEKFDLPNKFEGTLYSWKLMQA